MDPTALFDRYGAMVYRRALRVLGNAADAEEATQEVFIRAFKALADFDPRAEHSTWLFRITTNYCLNQIRNRARRAELLDARRAEVPQGAVPADPEKLALMRDLRQPVDEDQERRPRRRATGPGGALGLRRRADAGRGRRDPRGVAAHGRQPLRSLR